LKLSKHLMAIIIVGGFFIGFGSGLAETPGSGGIPENKYYGFPLGWRAVNTMTGDKYGYPLELFVDCLFGMLLVSIIAGTTIATERRLMKKSGKKGVK